jgi:hypothetical protein
MKGDHTDTTEGLYIDILGERRELTARTKAAFDPEGRRMRG